jgi:hypothetical protein
VRFQNWVAQGGIVALGVLLGYLIGHWRP